MAGVSVLHSKEAYKCKVLSGSPVLNVIMTVVTVFVLLEQKGMADVKHHAAWGVNM